ncbi:MAG: hypothetical protein WC662_03810 [Candidatus Paceibacterota bacterium]|jgi:hypothetical protein
MKFFGGGEKPIDFKAENQRLTEENNRLKSELLALQQKSTERGENADFELYKENAIFAPELKPYAEKVLGLMEMGKKLQVICDKFFDAEKETATPEQIQMFYKLFAKFQMATFYLKIGELNEQLNNIVYNNGILIKPPKGKEYNHSSVYATIRQAINENRSEESRIESFEGNINIGQLNLYCGALLVLVEDMKVLAESKISIPKEIDELREKLRLQITKELGLKINDVELLEKLNNNGYLEVLDEIDSSLTKDPERVVEVLYYGVGGYGGRRVDKTKVIISK